VTDNERGNEFIFHRPRLCQRPAAGSIEIPETRREFGAPDDEKFCAVFWFPHFCGWPSAQPRSDEMTVSANRRIPNSRPGPPHNPGVMDLVEGKRHWSVPLKPEVAKEGFRGWHERGYLPHRDEPGLTQFVTFRLADSFPEALRSEWEYLWKIEDERERRVQLENYLDRGKGKCYLRYPEVARLVEGALRFFDGARYELRAWTIMSNHVHVLFKVDAVPMSKILESWKKHTAIKANPLLKRSGAFWASDYFDTYMRDDEQERKTVRYIENNPTKAKLVLDPREWMWSSARYRDANGRLCF
jgi:putative transposase